MPRARVNHERAKKLSCLRCRKKFYSKTNILQHLNQPIGPCYGTNWYQDHSNRDDSELPQDNDQFAGPASSIPVPDVSRFADSDSQSELNHPPFLPSDSGLTSFDQEPGYYGMSDINNGQKFTEYFLGCSNSYAGGATFMDLFWQDEHAEEQQENLYFPFTSRNEWEFSSWCLHSGLSMAAIDSLLSLTIVSNQHFCPEL